MILCQGRRKEMSRISFGNRSSSTKKKRPLQRTSWYSHQPFFSLSFLSSNKTIARKIKKDMYVDNDDDKTGKKMMSTAYMTWLRWKLFLQERRTKVLQQQQQQYNSLFLFGLLVLTITTLIFMIIGTYRQKASSSNINNSGLIIISHPIQIRYTSPDQSSKIIRYTNTNNINNYNYNNNHTTTYRHISSWTKRDQEQQEHLKNDKFYDKPQIKVFTGYEDQPICKPMHKWQTHHYPTCNTIHEFPLNDLEQGKYLASGWYRSTFQVLNQYEPIAFKTLGVNKQFYWPNLLDRHRVDGLIYERTTKSPWITDIYGYCAFGGLFEYANGGTLMDRILRKKQIKRKLKPLTREQKLDLAIQTSSGMADLHTIESRNGYAAMSHTDIMLNQWVWVDGRYKLNDFNRGHLFHWNEMKQESCPYLWNEGNPANWHFRAPEEYKYEMQSEKVDVYSLGNTLYSIVTGIIPFDDIEDDEEAAKLVMDDKLPPLTESYLKSEHPIDRAMMKAMDMCFEYDWRMRSKASEVRDYLKSVKNNLKLM